jgi:hypothetical protein
MRALFLFLLAANLGFFAWANYFLPPDPGLDPRPFRQQYEPEKLRILRPESGSADTPVAVAPPAAPAAVCLEWGGFAIAETTRAEQALEPLALGTRLTQRRTDETAGWWVYIPSQATRQAAQRKASELKTLGIEDFFIVQDDGRARWAVSLGVFSSEPAARARLEALRAKGVRSAQLGERETPVQKVWFQVRSADAALRDRLRELAQAHPGTEVRDCP